VTRFDIVGCPQPGCTMPAESWPIYQTMNPTGGIIVYLRVLCLEGHSTFTEQAGTSGQTEAPPSTFSG
jgi:hypothetical protein